MLNFSVRKQNKFSPSYFVDNSSPHLRLNHKVTVEKWYYLWTLTEPVAKLTCFMKKLNMGEKNAKLRVTK